MKNIFKLLAFLPLLTACDDLFEPALENNRDLEAMYKEPSYAQGILANAYIYFLTKLHLQVTWLRMML